MVNRKRRVPGESGREKRNVLRVEGWAGVKWGNVVSSAALRHTSTAPALTCSGAILAVDPSDRAEQLRQDGLVASSPYSFTSSSAPILPYPGAFVECVSVVLTSGLSHAQAGDVSPGSLVEPSSTLPPCSSHAHAHAHAVYHHAGHLHHHRLNPPRCTRAPPGHHRCRRLHLGRLPPASPGCMRCRT